jgi:ABC transport system ATP-binding/permease protein
MSLLIARGIEKSFGDRRILRGCDLSVARGERVGLVGVNGCGKSTLLRIVGGLMETDHGEVDREGTVALLEQEPVLPGITVGEAADEAMSWHGRLLASFDAALATGDLDAQGRLQARLDDVGWTLDHRIDAVLQRLGAPPRDALISQLSGGELRRVALARALLSEPDLLLLDEPTNHLDVETTDWLQEQLEAWRGAVVLVTHDRYLLEAVATRIVEVEDGESVEYPGSYGDYLVERAERRERLHRAEDARLAYLAREAEWAARSPAARTTKQKARLDRLAELRTRRPIRREETFELDLRSSDKTGRTLLDIRDLQHGYDERTLIDHLDLGVTQGERIGVVGPNGCGKSTLLKLVAGMESSRGGSITRGGRVQVALLDQHRSGLKPKDTVFEAAAGGASHVTLGDRNVHVAGFLRRFLFAREMLDQPVAKLSGGERARLLLARLLLQGANLLLLDEPTNDLDVLTLRVLEEALLGFDGAALIATHDRAFLDRTCTSILGFVGDGTVLHFGSRQQLAREAQRRRAEREAAVRAEKSSRRDEVHRSRREAKAAARPRTLSFNERREYEALPARIEELEGELEAVEAELGDPATYAGGGGERVVELTSRQQAIPRELEGIYARWEELEELA